MQDQDHRAEDAGALTSCGNNHNPTFLTPAGVARRWNWHPESVRRALRERRLASIINGRRRLIPVGEVLRVEAAGFVAAKL